MVKGAVAPLLIKHASQDERFKNHPSLKEFGIESFIAVPLFRRDKSYFGTLCALDKVPTRIDESHFPIFKLMAELISFELEAQQEKLKRENEINTLNDIIAITNHDLRQPLTVMLLRAQFASRQARVEKSSTELIIELDKLVDDIQRGSRLVDSLMDVGRLETGSFRLEPGEVDMVKLVRQAVENTQAIAPFHLFDLNVPAKLVLRGDYIRLSQVVHNLLSNAVKYSPGLHSPVEVTLLAIEFQGKVLCQVRDYGMGVSPGELPRLFERKYRTHQAQASGIEGSGYGLYIARQIVEAHGGQIWAEIPYGGGTRFNFTLPV